MRNPVLFPPDTLGDYAFTLRDLAAIAALKGHLSADADAFYGSRQEIVQGAVKWADALLTELEKVPCTMP